MTRPAVTLRRCTLLRLRDRHGITGAFAAAVFQYGSFDLSMTPSQRLWGERNLVLSGPIISWFLDQFLPTQDREQRRDPDISPLFADLSGMPPAIFTVGTAGSAARRHAVHGGALASRRVTAPSCGSGPKRRTGSSHCR